MRYRQYTEEKYNFLKILCVSDVYSVFYSSSHVWVFCPFFVSWQGRQYYILVPRGKVLSLLIKRRFIIKCSFSFCPLELFFFSPTLTIPRLLASFIRSLYQVWMLSLLNYGS